MAGFNFPDIAQGLGNDQSQQSSCTDGGSTIQRMVLCDKTINVFGVHIPAIIVAVVGGILLWFLINALLTSIFPSLPASVDFFMGLLRIGAILFAAYAIQKFLRVRNMYPGMWPCGFKPDKLCDPAAQAVSTVICKLGGLKNAACKVGGLSQLAQSVGGLSVLIKASGGLACIINDYGTFEQFVCEFGGADKLAEELPNGDLYAAMGATNPNDIPMPMDSEE